MHGSSCSLRREADPTRADHPPLGARRRRDEGLVRVREELRLHLAANCPVRTDAMVMKRLGISYNTLRKIEAGEPIRRSVAARLEERISRELRG